MPRQAMATVNGVTHRLKWLDRNSGWRMGCSCGWADPKLRGSQSSAINAGNAHITGARRAARTPHQKRQDQVVRRFVAVAIGLAIVVALIVHFINAATRTSYDDGYAWGQAETVGIISKTAPSCSQSEMVSSGPVNDPNFVYNRPSGADQPNDNFAQWQAGCEAGAQNTINSFNSP